MAVKLLTPDALRAALGADASSAARVASIHAAVMRSRETLREESAPTEVKNESVILLAGWLWQATAQSRRVFPG